MPVNWSGPQKRKVGPSFVRCPPNRIVQLLCSHFDYPVIDLHYLEGQRTSVPCMGQDECHYHHLKLVRSAYAPVMVWNVSLRVWIPGILGIGDPSHTLATTELHGCPIVIGKDKEGAARSRLVYYGKPTTVVAALKEGTPTFDVRPHLLRRWGLFKEADLLECEYHEAQDLIPFGNEDVG
jgi:hypothetical protein